MQNSRSLKEAFDFFVKLLHIVSTTTKEFRKMVNRQIQPWFIPSFFDTGYPCFGQLIPVKTYYPLTSITWSYRGFDCRAYRGHLFFEVDRWPSAGFRLDRGPFYCLLPTDNQEQTSKPHNHSVDNLFADQVRGQTRERTHRHPAKGCREIWGWLFLRIFCFNSEWRPWNTETAYI